LNNSGSFVYSPNTGFIGSDEFQYEICTNGQCDIGIVKISIVPNQNLNNNQPLAVDDGFVNIVNSNISGNILSNDFDVDGNTISYQLNTTSPANGTVTVSSNGNFTYTPNVNYTGTDKFTYQICDNGSPLSKCSFATVYLVISNAAPNSPPIAVDDNYNTTLNSQLIDNFQSNDSDPEGDNIFSFTSSINGPYNGTVNITTNGGFDYTPTIGYVGLDSFQYIICDDGAPILCDSAWVSINIQSCPVNIGNIIATNITNCNVNNGSIEINIASGSGSYLYSIDSGSTWVSNNTFTGLSSGNYPIAVQDLINSCSAYGQIINILGTSEPIITNVVGEDPTDCNIVDGIITISANSPAGLVLQYSIDNIEWQSSNVFLDLPGGTYSIYVSNADTSCVVSNGSITLLDKIQPIYSSVTSLSPSDCGVIDGQIVIDAIGASLEYSIDGGFSWQSTGIFNNLDAGDYIVLIRNTDGSCETTYTNNPVVLTAPLSPFIVNTIGSNPSKCLVLDGSIDIQASGGTGIYDYSIDSGTTWQANNLFSGLGGGVYGVRVRNNDGTCIVSDVDMVLVDRVVTVIDTVLYTNTSDCGASDGSIFVSTPLVGIFGYTIDGGVNWKGSSGGGELFPNLPSGIYTILMISPDSTCLTPYSTPIVISDPNEAIIDSITHNNPSDCGIDNGTIQIFAIGDSILEYSIDGGNLFQSSNLFTGLAGDEYEIKVRNVGGTCVVDGDSLITLIAPIMPIIANVSTIDISDCDSTNGQINITAVSGSGNYEYSINGGSIWSSSSTFTDLANGNYSIQTRNADGTCIASTNDVTINDAMPPSIDTVLTTAVSDCGLSDGTITVTTTVSGLQAYSIDGGTSFILSNNGATFTGLATGNYNVVIANSDGSCMTDYAYNSVIVDAPIAPSITGVGSTDPTDCNIMDGEITITSSGVGTYQYSIDGGTNWQTSSVFNNLNSGSYTIAISNMDTTCIVYYVNNSVQLSAPSAPTITNTEVNQPINCGVSNGSINLTVTGGAGVFEYSIDSGSTWSIDSSFTNLLDDVYHIRVRNLDGTCTVLGQAITIASPISPSITNVNTTEPTDCGVSDGVINITATSGSSIALEYSINGGSSWSTSNVFFGLTGGIYEIRTRKVDGTCEISDADVILTNRTLATIDTVIIRNLQSCGINDGQIEIQTLPVLATDTVEYSIDGGINWTSNNLFIGLSAGNYNIVIRYTDGSCEVLSTTNPAVIDEAPIPFLSSVSSTDVTDCNQFDGTITLTGASGIGTYQYSIDSGLTWHISNIFTGLDSGTYYTFVKNSNNTCPTEGQTISLIEPIAPVFAGITASSPTDCGVANGTITVNATSPDNIVLEYSINGGMNWQVSNQFTGLIADSYSIKIRNYGGTCLVNGTDTTLIDKNPPIIISVVSNNATNCGASDGNITITAVDANGTGLEYSINGGFTWFANNIFTNLGSGSYDVAIRNIDGTCLVLDANSPVQLSAPSSPTITNTQVSQITDCNLSDASIEIQVSGGTGIFEYSIDSGATWQIDSSFVGLSNDVYHIRVRNLDGTCPVLGQTVTILAPVLPSIATVNSINPTDCGTNDGVINITANSGSSIALEYSINGGTSWFTSNVFFGLTGGVYEIRARKVDGTCIVSDTDVVLIDKNSAAIDTVIITDVQSCDIDDGKIEIQLAPLSGTSTVEYSIDGGINWSSNNLFTGLSSGNYNIAIRYTDGTCEVLSTTNPAVINDALIPLLSNVSSSNPLNCNQLDGTITLTGTNGIGTYKYSIDSGLTWQASNMFTGLDSGTYYTFIKNDNNTCPTSGQTIVLTAPVEPIFTGITASSPTDCGVANGTIAVASISPNNTILEYSINGGITWQVSNLFTGLVADSYSIKIRNIGGTCLVDGTDTILIDKIAPIITSVTSNSATNCGANDGNITITAVDASGLGLEYSINGGFTWFANNTFINLGSGSYDVAIRNSDGTCLVLDTNNPVQLSAPSAPAITNTQVSQITDCGFSDGSIDLTVTGGTGSYEYSIDSGTTWAIDSSFTNLPIGVYHIRVRNLDGTCTILGQTVVLNSPASPTIANVQVADLTDCDVTDGSISITAMNGIGTYQYSIDGGLIWNSSSVFINLSSGTYSIRVRNSDETCMVSSSDVTINDIVSPTIDTVFTTDVTNCNGSDGTITITTSETTLQAYSIDGGASFVLSSNGTTFSGLSSGNYDITIANAGGTCMKSYIHNSVTIGTPVGPSMANQTFIEPSDCNISNGSISITATGGGTYQYSIDGGINWQTSPNFNGLNSGSYTTAVSNLDTTCIIYASNTIQLSAPSAPTITNTQVKEPTNCGLSDGSIDLTVTGGTGTFEYSIDSGMTWATSGSFAGLFDGIYHIRVRNLNGTCTVLGQTVILKEPALPVIANVQTTDLTDCNVTDGSVSITAINGIGSYEYSIDGGTTWNASSIFSNLSSGIYGIRVRNGDGTCMVNGSDVTINDVISPSVDTVLATDVTNCGGNDGTITITTSETNLQAYSIDGGANFVLSSNGTTFNGLSAGTYNIVMANAGGTCVTNYTNNPITINTPFAPTITNVISNAPTDCNISNGSISITATGTGTNQYSIDGGINWQISPNFNSLNSGDYTVAVSNLDTTCIVYYANNTIQLSAPSAPTITNTQVSQPSDCSISDGSIDLTVIGGTGTFEYSINGGLTWLTNSNFTNLPADIYDIRVRNLDGTCTVLGQTITIAAPTLPNITNVAFTEPTDCGINDGVIDITANSGNGQALEYSIDSGLTWSSSNVFLGLASGTYKIRVMKADGTCQVSDSDVILTDKIPLSIDSVVVTDPLSCGINDGSIKIFVAQIVGTTTVEYSIDGGINWSLNDIFTGLMAGNYNVAVRYIDGSCEFLSATNPAVINQAPEPYISNVSSNDPTNCNQFDGIITLTGASGIGTYEYSVDSGLTWQSSNIFTGLGSETYYTFIKNSNNTCATSGQTIVLTAPAEPVFVGITGESPTDCNIANGTITINATSPNNAILEYSINGGTNWQFSNLFTGLNADTYSTKIRNYGGTCLVDGADTTLIDKVAPVLNSVTSNSATNCGISDGNIAILATDASGLGLQYSIDGGFNWVTNSVFTNLSSGSYAAYVRNADGTCAVPYGNNPINLSDATAPSITNINKTEPTDCDSTNGTITIFAMSGSGTLQYSINNGTNWQISNLFTELGDGTYDIVVRNADSTCVISGSPVALVSPTAPTINSFTAQDPSNCGLQDGFIQISAISTIGGSLEFSSDSGTSWQTSSSFLGLSDGIYNLYVKNSGSQCIVSAGDTTLNSPQSPQFDTVNTVAVTGCVGFNGQMSVSMQGDTTNLEYSINGFSWQPSPVFTGLISGSYTVLVRNNSGVCETSYPNNPVVIGSSSVQADTTTVSEFTCDANSAGSFYELLQGTDGCDSLIIRTVTLNAPTIVIVKVSDVTDCNLTDGAIILAGTGGNGSYEYSIDSGLTFQPADTFFNLPSGIYYPFIRNSDTTCSIAGMPVEVKAPNTANIDSLDVVDITDCGQSDGVISVFTSSSITLEYSNDSGFTWQSANTFTNLPSGTYHMFVRNFSGSCIVGDSVAVINSPPALTIDTVLTSNMTDCDSTNGTIQVLATGTSLEYSINGGFTWTSSNTFINLATGFYNIAVRNGNGTCLTIYSSNPITLTAPSAPVITSILKTDPTDCGLMDGTIEILIGSTGNYIYSIDSGQTYSTSNIFTSLSGGTYTIFVANTDTTCIVQGFTQVLIDKIAPTVISPPVSSPISDCGLTDGTIQINATGGSSGLIYSIDNGSSWFASSLFINLSAGVYPIAVANPDTTCVTSIGVETIINQSTPTINNVNITDVTDCNQPNGIIQILAIGDPTLTLEYSVNGGATYQLSSTFNNLTAGNYYIAIRYNNAGCEIIDTTLYNVGALNGPDIVDVDHTDPTGCGLNDGTITVTATGGLAPTIYSKDNGVTWTTDNFFNNLPSDTYVILVSNSDTTCTIPTIPIIIDSLPNVIIDSLNFTAPTNCAKGDGSITIYASTFNSTLLEYSGNGGQTWQSNPTIGGLYTGEHDLVVRSGVGCETSFENYVLNSLNNDLIDTVEGLSPTSCNTSDGALVIYGNSDLTNLAYSLDGVTWQTTNVFSSLNGGQYNVQVRSLSTVGCIDYDTLIISSPDSGNNATIMVNPVSCYGGDDGSYEIQLTLSTGVVIKPRNNVKAGFYTEELRDEFGCGQTVTVLVTEPDPLELILNPIPIEDGQNTGSIEIKTEGGTKPYKHYIRKEGDIDTMTVPSNFIVSDLEEGRYIVMVVDSNDCYRESVVELKDERLEVFNTMTPNGDGANDYLAFDKIRNNECTQTNELVVFNRWGQVVYMVTDYANDWEGTDLSGGKLPSGAYFYIFKCYKDGVATPDVEKGSLTILRTE
jgi:gliding motility-associated-like protein